MHQFQSHVSTLRIALWVRLLEFVNRIVESLVFGLHLPPLRSSVKTCDYLADVDEPWGVCSPTLSWSEGPG